MFNPTQTCLCTATNYWSSWDVGATALPNRHGCLSNDRAVIIYSRIASSLCASWTRSGQLPERNSYLQAYFAISGYPHLPSSVQQVAERVLLTQPICPPEWSQRRWSLRNGDTVHSSLLPPATGSTRYCSSSHRSVHFSRQVGNLPAWVDRQVGSLHTYGTANLGIVNWDVAFHTPT